MSYYLGPRVDINGKIRRISIGSGIDESNTYTIYKDGIPVMEATGPRCGWNPFDTAYIFQNHLCIGAGETVYFISIETGELRKTGVSMYFGCFYEDGDRLYVASESRLYCFSCTCELIWTSESIAVDGIIINGIQDNYIALSCEREPPGGWMDCVLSKEDGKEIRRDDNI